MFLAQFLLVTAQKQNLYCPFCMYHIDFLVEIFILFSYCVLILNSQIEDAIDK